MPQSINEQIFKNQINAINPKIKKQKKPLKIFHPKNEESKLIKDYVKRQNELKKIIVKLLVENLGMIKNESDFLHLDSWSDDIEEIFDEIRRESESGPFKKENIAEVSFSSGAAVAGFNLMQFKKSIASSVGVNPALIEPYLEDQLKNFSQNNAALITKMSKQEIDEIEEITRRGFQSRTVTKDIAKEIQEKLEINKKKARFIARDQVSKLNGNLTELRQTELGIEMYIWRTAEDERVRGNESGKYPVTEDKHNILNEKYCRWDDKTVYSNDQGQTWIKRSNINAVELHPGEDYNCRCYAEPVLQELIEE